MNRDIHEGFVTERHKVGPCVLHPYSAAHAFALEAMGWSKDQLATPAGILRFLNVCSRTIGDNCQPENFPHGKIGLRLSAYGVALALSLKERTAAINAVNAYLADSLTTPRVDRPDGGQSDDLVTCDNQLLTRVCMGIKCGLSEFRAWSMPLGALNSYLIHFDVAECRMAGRKFDGSLADPDLDALLEAEFKKESA